MFEFRKLASRLARDTKDSVDDKSLDLDIAQASHVIKVMKEIAGQDPDLIGKVFKLPSRSPRVLDRLRNSNNHISKSPDNTKHPKRGLTTAFYRASR